MLDLDIGMNSHLAAPFQWDDARRYDRGKVMTRRISKPAREFGRYLDVDGDGVPFRTLPGAHPTRGAYFTRGTSRDKFARYTEEGNPYVENMERLLRKWETARWFPPRKMRRAAKPTSVGVIYYGSTGARDGRGAVDFWRGKSRFRRDAASRLSVRARSCRILCKATAA